MGKGDPRTKRGKIFRHSYGKFRARKEKLPELGVEVNNSEIKVEQEIIEQQHIETVAEVIKEVKPKKSSAKKSPAKKNADSKSEETAG